MHCALLCAQGTFPDKGEVAVKRMEVVQMSGKGQQEFQVRPCSSLLPTTALHCTAQSGLCVPRV